MHFKHWTGYLRKLNCEPILLLHLVHRLGLNRILLLNYHIEVSRSIVLWHLSGCSRSFSNIIAWLRRFYGELFWPAFNINLDGITLFDDLPPESSKALLETPFNVGHCFVLESHYVPSTVKTVLETVLAHESIESDDSTFLFGWCLSHFALDNCATHHICNDKSLFTGPIQSISNVGITGVGGTVSPVGIESIAFTVRDCGDVDHPITLSNVIYLPDCPKNLISILCWSLDKGDDCGIFSQGRYSIFLWNHDKLKCMVDHPADCPIPILSINKGAEINAEAFLFGGPTSQPMSELIVPTTDFVSASSPEPSDVLEHPDSTDLNDIIATLNENDLVALWKTPDSNFSDDKHLFAYWHKRLCHAPKKYICYLVKHGCLPAQLATIMRMSLCPACVFADASKHSWCNSKHHKSIWKEDSKPGDATSCDHLISHEPGLIPQVTDHLTYLRYSGAVIFTDNSSDYTYSHLIMSTSLEETLFTKHSYEYIAKEHGMDKIHHYHADNLRFNDEDFQADCHQTNQKLTFWGVGAHHQNGVPEAKNKILSYQACKLLLHACCHWKSILWPYALAAATKCHNELSLDEDGKSPLGKFSNIQSEIECDDFHTWGCPIFVLDARNQSGLTGTPKWELHSRVGVYLGHSPAHAGNVSLFLNLQTGHVSPQYHVVFDDAFSTVPYLESSKEPPNWCKLVSDSSEHATDEQYDTATTWYSGSPAYLPTTPTAGEMRENVTSPPHDYSEASKPTTSQPFADI